MANTANDFYRHRFGMLDSVFISARPHFICPLLQKKSALSTDIESRCGARKRGPLRYANSATAIRAGPMCSRYTNAGMSDCVSSATRACASNRSTVVPFHLDMRICRTEDRRATQSPPLCAISRRLILRFPIECAPIEPNCLLPDEFVK